MAWLYLLIAGIFEIVWAVGIKYCDGFKISIASVAVLSGMLLSLVFLWLAMRSIPISVAYAAWSGIGIAGVLLYGVFVLQEPVSLMQIAFVGLILVGIVGLKLCAK